ncbi:MAG: hypothetical protein ABR609_05530 [Acidimicrobiia bacterium]
MFDEVDVDEVHAQRLVLHSGFLEIVHQGVDELVHLLVGGRANRPLDPGIGVTDVLLGDPRVVHLEVEADVTLLVDDGLPAPGQHHVTEARLEPVPTRGQRGGDVSHVLVVEQEHGAEPIPFQGGVGLAICNLEDPDGYRIELVEWPPGHPDGMTSVDFL